MALLLLVLAALPFTSPFSTFDLSAFTGNAPISVELVAAEKKVEDSAADLVSYSSTLLAFVLVSPLRPAAGRVQPSHSPRLVLRIGTKARSLFWAN